MGQHHLAKHDNIEMSRRDLGTSGRGRRQNRGHGSQEHRRCYDLPRAAGHGITGWRCPKENMVNYGKS